MDPKDEQKVHDDILYWAQGVGSIKNIDGYDVYVKSEFCEDSLKQIQKHLKMDGQSYPIVRHFLGDWRFFQSDLLNLLIFHKQDKLLSLYTVMIMQ